MKRGARYLLIVGNIAAGKTTLAQALAARLSAVHYPEPFETNPFLNHFYAQPKTFALRSQLAFLLEHYRQHCAIAAGTGWAVKDGSLWDSGDVVTRGLRGLGLLTSDEWDLYCGLQQALRAHCAPPALVVLLKAAPALLLQRIRDRGRVFEQGIELDFLTRLDAIYDEWAATWDESPIVRIDSTEVDIDIAAARALRAVSSLVATFSS